MKGRAVKTISRTPSVNQLETCERASDVHFSRLTTYGRHPMPEFLPLDFIDVCIANDHRTWTGTFGPGLPMEALRSLAMQGSIASVTHEFHFPPWQLLPVILAGWINQHQPQIIQFQRTEVDVLKEKLGEKRIILNDDQRRRLAVKAQALGRKVSSVVSVSSPHGILLAARRGSLLG
ncbi:MAG TPA: hypothetical protein VMY37_15520 [Thermoguttaceae bacterium]|nr:hypothetical protein [Thermoguttaceae bacterium]